MAHGSARLEVVIATAGRPDLLERTLTSIAECRIPQAYSGLLVVENGVQDGIDAIVAQHAGPPMFARYLYSDLPRKCRALNLALEEFADDTLVVFADDDIRVHPEWLQAYAEAVRDLRGGVMLGGPFGVDYEEPPAEWLRRYLPASARGMNGQGGWPMNLADFQGFLGFNWAAFAGDLRRAGGFNEELGPGSLSVGDETDMQRRLRALGVSARLLPEAMVWHYVPRSRCSEEWVLQRAYIQGRTSGTTQRSAFAAEPGATGMAGARLLKAVAVRQALSRWYRLRSGFPFQDDVARFEATRRAERYRGWADGLVGRTGEF